MQSSADHLELAPPTGGRWLGPVMLALLAHALLVTALTWGVNWRHEPAPVVFEAELWSSLPQAAAPRAVEPAPVPAPVPAPAPATPPAPEPATQPADLAIQHARAEQRRQQAAAERLAREEQASAERQREQERQRSLQEQRQTELAAQVRRDEQMRRIMGQADASGAAQASGSALRAGGPSLAYAARVAASIKPNVVFTDPVAGNPRAEVEVRTLPDGTITARRLLKSSGNPAWDEAVLRAIDRTATLPRDVDGRVPSALIIGLRPLD